MSAAVDAVLLIDGFMSDNSGRSLFSDDEIQNLLLDIRSLISPLALAESLVVAP